VSAFALLRFESRSYSRRNEAVAAMTPFFRSVSRSRAAHAPRLLSTVAEHATPPTRRRLRELPPPLNLVR
jgi:hypothetical protein